MRHLKRISWLLAALLPAAALAQQDHHDHSETAAAPSEQSIGTVDFGTSCQPAVRDDFNRATALLHSFWWTESRRAFEHVLQSDSHCAMAHWGIALTWWGNPFAGLKSAQMVEGGKAAIDKAKASAPPTAREKGFIDAAAILFSSTDPATQPARVASYEEAMARVAADNPSDVEARIFWALAIAQAAKPTDKTFANQLKAAAILEPLFKQMPQHPGIAHYIIHSYDVPALATKALSAARAYADIAPSAPHALHMPSHTFTRVGLWKESVATNARSAQVAEQAGEFGDALHALDYMTYAYLQMGMDADAQQAASRANTLMAKQADVGGVPNAFAIAAIPARVALERQDWKAASQLEVRPSPGTPYAEALTHFARAVAMARSGNPAAAKPDIARLAALRERETELKDPYWTEIVDIQRRGAEAWVLFAEGKRDDSIRLMSAAADAEDATEKAAITPGPLAPAREMLGTLLLESGKPADALKAFEIVIVHEPNRFQSLYGAAQAAEKAGQPDKAKKYYRQIVDICAAAGASSRASLEYARKHAGS